MEILKFAFNEQLEIKMSSIIKFEAEIVQFTLLFICLVFKRKKHNTVKDLNKLLAEQITSLTLL